MNQSLVISQVSELAVLGAFGSAERSLVAFAEKHGDQQLRALLDEMEPKHLSLIVREFDCSKSSPLSLLVGVDQFIAMLMLERQYNELNKLEGLINSVVMARDEQERSEFFTKISECSCEDILAIYLLSRGGQNYERIVHFQRYMTFNLGSDEPDTHSEVLDGEWKQFAFELREGFPDFWESVYQCAASMHTRIMQNSERQERTMSDALELQENNKNNEPKIPEQADENSAL
ncbi:MAG: hypothetical protein U0518_04760 [Candidatus Gracilibacteria bacterium]